MKKTFQVTGMSCSACSSRVERAVRAVPGVDTVAVNLLTNTMQVEYKEEATRKIIEDAVEKAGYQAFSLEEKEETRSHTGKDTRQSPAQLAKDQGEEIKKRLLVSLLYLIPLLYMSMGHMLLHLPLPSIFTGPENGVSYGLTEMFLCIPVLYLNRIYFKRGYRSLWHKSPNMDSLIAIGTTAAFAYGVFAIYAMSYGLGQGDMNLVTKYHSSLYFESAAMIPVLISLGKYFEARSKGRTSQALDKLLALIPEQVIVIEESEEKLIPIEEVRKGDMILVRPGTTIPVDGVLLGQSASIDEASITGESIPVYKKEGDELTGGTMNLTGAIKMRATRVGEDTTFSQIIHLVEEASGSKAPIARLADQVAGIFVPIVFLLSLLTLGGWLLAGATAEFAITSAVCVLVISCPCALGLATPVAIMVGTGKGAENGILIRSGEALETAHKLSYVILDKTGTITEGKPRVTDLVTKMDVTRFLQMVGGLEHGSEHPLSVAVREYVGEQGISYSEAKDFQVIPGGGVEASVDGEHWMAGNQRLLGEFGISTKEVEEVMEKMAKEGKTPLLFAREHQIVGVMGVADKIKETSSQAVKKLQELGLKVVMLTGDHKETAEEIGRQVGISQVVAQVLPRDKEEVVKEFQKQGLVAMVGDGINDAPALAQADVGIAIGSGTDVAIESADVILMRNDLMDVVNAIELSKAVIRNIKENLFWAFFYNLLGIPLAAGLLYPVWGWQLSPIFGAAAMGCSSVFVVSNALRLKLFRGEKVTKEEVKMKTLKIQGMMCQHCVAHVTEALNAIPGVTAQVDLQTGQAFIQGEADTKTLIQAVTDAGYQATEVE